MLWTRQGVFVRKAELHGRPVLTANVYTTRQPNKGPTKVERQHGMYRQIDSSKPDLNSSKVIDGPSSSHLLESNSVVKDSSKPDLNSSKVIDGLSSLHLLERNSVVKDSSKPDLNSSKVIDGLSSLHLLERNSVVKDFYDTWLHILTSGHCLCCFQFGTTINCVCCRAVRGLASGSLVHF
ncbi:uncharacterized protein [Bemisia tabaci]|uniref:uncharacterized protein n=1 Tax=Bemisia tabaci TaxID=7038 RepID=UPI003B284304